MQALEKGPRSLFQLSHERKLIFLSAVLIAISLVSLRANAFLDTASIHSLESLEIWAFKLTFAGVACAVGVVALLVGIVDSRLVTNA
jgi:hypothetical protein